MLCADTNKRADIDTSSYQRLTPSVKQYHAHQCPQASGMRLLLHLIQGEGKEQYPLQQADRLQDLPMHI